jgi:hypothetical protein
MSAGMEETTGADARTRRVERIMVWAASQR